MDNDYAGYPNDDEILEKLAKNLDAYFHLLIDSYKSIVYRVAYNILHCKEDAEEATWGTFKQAYQALSKLQKEGQDIRRHIRLRPWLFTIARNTSISRRRQDGRSPPSTPLKINEEGDLVEGTPDSPSAEIEVVQREKDDKLYTWIAQLPDRDYEIIRLYYFEGLSDPKIASRFKENLETIKKARQRALQKLRDMMPEDEDYFLN